MLSAKISGFLFVNAWVFTLAIGFPLAAMWLFSMKVGARLAEDDIVEVSKNAHDPTACETDEAFDERVANPTRELTDTMQLLSRGWGSGVGLGILALWLYAFSRFADFLLELHKLHLGLGTGEYTQARAFRVKMGPGIVLAIAPLIIVMDMATVSSMCDQLQSAINAFGLKKMSTEEAAQVHQRTFPLLNTLQSMHSGQGMGFLVCESPARLI